MILKEDELVISFKKPLEPVSPTAKIAWDSNMKSLDGFTDNLWIIVDLTPIFH